jgi:Xaa-Pro aminopeptidase
MSTFFEANRDKLANQMLPGEVIVLFAGKAPKSTADAHYSFKMNKNFYYLTGIKNEHFALVLHKRVEQCEAVLFIEKPDYDIEKWVGRKLKKEDATRISGIQNIQFLDAFERYITQNVYQDSIKKIYLDLEKLSWDEDDSQAHKFSNVLKNKFPHLMIDSCHPILSKARVVKEAFEVDQINKAIQLTKQGLDEVLNQLKPGMFEYQLESIFAHGIRYNGADGNSFPTIVASGSDAVILHYVENNKILEENQLVLLDLGAQYHEYCADISRTYPVSGKFTDTQKTFYTIVLKAMDAVIDIMKPGIHFSELNKRCKEVLAQELMAIGFISRQEELDDYYYHGVSHHLGLDVHDLGGRDLFLEAGMVLTVEPGLYIAKEGIGIRIEDDILITQDGNINLSSCIPKQIEEIEALMSK